MRRRKVRVSCVWEFSIISFKSLSICQPLFALHNLRTLPSISSRSTLEIFILSTNRLEQNSKTSFASSTSDSRPSRWVLPHFPHNFHTLTSHTFHTLPHTFFSPVEQLWILSTSSITSNSSINFLSLGFLSDLAWLGLAWLSDFNVYLDGLRVRTSAPTCTCPTWTSHSYINHLIFPQRLDSHSFW